MKDVIMKEAGNLKETIEKRQLGWLEEHVGDHITDYTERQKAALKLYHDGYRVNEFGEVHMKKETESRTENDQTLEKDTDDLFVRMMENEMHELEMKKAEIAQDQKEIELRQRRERMLTNMRERRIDYLEDKVRRLKAKNKLYKKYYRKVIKTAIGLESM